MPGSTSETTPRHVTLIATGAVSHTVSAPAAAKNGEQQTYSGIRSIHPRACNGSGSGRFRVAVGSNSGVDLVIELDPERCGE